METINYLKRTVVLVGESKKQELIYSASLGNDFYRFRDMQGRYHLLRKRGTELYDQTHHLLDSFESIELEKECPGLVQCTKKGLPRFFSITHGGWILSPSGESQFNLCFSKGKNGKSVFRFERKGETFEFNNETGRSYLVSKKESKLREIVLEWTLDLGLKNSSEYEILSNFDREEEGIKKFLLSSLIATKFETALNGKSNLAVEREINSLLANKMASIDLIKLRPRNDLALSLNVIYKETLNVS